MSISFRATMSTSVLPNLSPHAGRGLKKDKPPDAGQHSSFQVLLRAQCDYDVAIWPEGLISYFGALLEKRRRSENR